jgi:hypothetical protein
MMRGFDICASESSSSAIESFGRNSVNPAAVAEAPIKRMTLRLLEHLRGLFSVENKGSSTFLLKVMPCLS